MTFLKEHPDSLEPNVWAVPENTIVFDTIEAFLAYDPLSIPDWQNLMKLEFDATAHYTEAKYPQGKRRARIVLLENACHTLLLDVNATLSPQDRETFFTTLLALPEAEDDLAVRLVHILRWASFFGCDGIVEAFDPPAFIDHLIRV
jgi:hypothetical protein